MIFEAQPWPCFELISRASVCSGVVLGSRIARSVFLDDLRFELFRYVVGVGPNLVDFGCLKGSGEALPKNAVAVSLGREA